jgi:hypothetical protein
VTCSQDAQGDVYIRAQSNGMPNHCFKATNANATVINSDFTVKFNKDVSNVTNYDETDVETQEKVSELMCDLQRTASTNMPSGTNYSEASSGRLLKHINGTN